MNEEVIELLEKKNVKPTAVRILYQIIFKISYRYYRINFSRLS